MSQNLILYTTQDKKIKARLYEFAGSMYHAQNLITKLFLKKLCFNTSKSSISEHIKNILEDGELQEDSVRKEYLHTANDNKQYKLKFYSLEMILRALKG